MTAVKFPTAPRNPLPYLALSSALRQALDERTPPRCAGRDEPYSDDEQVRAMVAADWCPSCPIHDACREAGAYETTGVWGSVDRTPLAKTSTRTTTTSKEKNR
ncbi:hypothetical protein [Tessaracoccus sp. Z1128]